MTEAEAYVCERAPEGEKKKVEKERERKRDLKDTVLSIKAENLYWKETPSMYKPGCLCRSKAQGSERKGTNQEPKLCKEGPWINW